MRFMTGLVCVTALALAACGGGGGSGLDGNKALGSLTSAELMELCEYVAEAGPQETVDCGDGVTVGPTTAAECAMDPFPTDCTATVDDAEACADAIGDDPCNAFESEACAPIFACFSSQ